MTSAVIAQRVVPRSRVSSVLLVIGAAALTALAAQWEIHLPFTPVPVTGSDICRASHRRRAGHDSGGCRPGRIRGRRCAGAPGVRGGCGRLEHGDARRAAPVI